jgi:TRAP-type C4-dicarboxylate transport system substrate-binding protein
MAGEGLSENKFLIKFATIAPEGSTWINHMKTLDETLRKRTNGQLGLRIYAGGIAGDELDVLSKMRIGQIQCSGFSGVGIAQILPMVRVLDLPFLFRNDKEVDLVQNALKDFFAEKFRDKGFEFLSWAEVGNIYLFSKKPIRRVSDVSGLKIWTWTGDPISKETFTVMGTSPIPLSITDVTTALNTGMIDTVYGPVLGALALQWNTYTNYMTSLPLAHASSVVLISSDYFRRIPPDLGRLLKEEFERATALLTTDLRSQSEEAIKLIQKSGVEILPMPSGPDLEEFYRVHDQVARKLIGVVYPEELLERVYALLHRR